MEAHLQAPITIAEVVSASGVAGRALFKHFKDYRGVAPMQHLRSMRFRRVREALLRAEPEQGVTSIAMSFGFNHLGRFSMEYRRRFGESPSSTLGKPRRRSKP